MIPSLGPVGTAEIETMSRVTSFTPRTQTGNCSSYIITQLKGRERIWKVKLKGHLKAVKIVKSSENSGVRTLVNLNLGKGVGL